MRSAFMFCVLSALSLCSTPVTHAGDLLTFLNTNICSQMTTGQSYCNSYMEQRIGQGLSRDAAISLCRQSCANVPAPADKLVCTMVCESMSHIDNNYGAFYGAVRSRYCLTDPTAPYFKGCDAYWSIRFNEGLGRNDTFNKCATNNAGSNDAKTACSDMKLKDN